MIHGIWYESSDVSNEGISILDAIENQGSHWRTLELCKELSTKNAKL